MSELKIVQINSGYGNAGSTNRTTKEMHEWLCAEGIDSYVYCTRVDEKNTDQRVRVYSTPYLQKVHAFLSRVTGLQGYFSFFDTKRLLSWMSKDVPDVVLLRVLHSNCINFPLLFHFLKKKRIPVIIVLHDCWFMTGHCVHFAEADCEKWKNGCSHCPLIKQHNKSWFFDTSRRCYQDKKTWYRGLDMTVIGVSKWIANLARQSILKNAVELDYIYNWIDQAVFFPHNRKIIRDGMKLRNDEVVLLGVSSLWDEEKGFSTIVYVANQFRQYRIVLIGLIKGQEALPDNIMCVGEVGSPNLLAEYYSMADVFMNPSKQETFGKVTAEAICCGTPIVAYRTTATTELVEQAGGMLVNPGDCEGFCSAIRKTLDEKNVDSIRMRELRFAEDAFDKEKKMEEYAALFERIISRKGCMNDEEDFVHCQ